MRSTLSFKHAALERKDDPDLPRALRDRDVIRSTYLPEIIRMRLDQALIERDLRKRVFERRVEAAHAGFDADTPALRAKSKVACASGN